MSAEQDLYLGIDAGTSGLRALLIDHSGGVAATTTRPWPPPAQTDDGGRRQDAGLWRTALLDVLQELAAGPHGSRIRAIAIDGTSGTLLLAGASGEPLAPARMYNDTSGAGLAQRIAALAPPESGAHGAASPLARLLLMQELHPDAYYALHQADWLAGQLRGHFGVSDDNNALKLGWDPIARRWPDWFDDLGVRREWLPEVAIPGAVLGAIDPALARRLGLQPETLIVAGTTDGCASFLATGADHIGDGVSALGSTLTVKLLGAHPIFAPAFGVYSHRLGERWLIGGASNTGGAALLRFFSAARMAELTPRLDPGHPTGLDYYPLPDRGERFPLADPDMASRHTPRPEQDERFFQGLLEGIAQVEARAYALLQELGGPALVSLRSVGGGASNPAWTRIRTRLLGVAMPAPISLEAAYGTALLARRGVLDE